MTATVASLRTAARISATSEVTTVQRQSRKRAKLAVAARIGEPEGLRHVGGKIDVAREIGARHLRATCAFKRRRIDARLLRALHAVIAETQAQLVVEPAIGRG